MTLSKCLSSVTFAALVVATLGTGCPNGQQTTCGGGGNNNDGCGHNECKPTVNSAWTDSRLGLQVITPPCPYTVGSKSAGIGYGGDDTTRHGNLTWDSQANFYVLDTVTDNTIIQQTGVQFTAFAFDTSLYGAHFFMTGYPGTYTVPGNDTLTVDELESTADNMYYGGSPLAWEIIHGHINNSSQALIGANAAVEGAPTMWRSEPAWDTTAYAFKWILDGTQVATTDEYTASLSTGLHTLSNVTIRTDNSRDSVVLAVKAYDAAINGPTTVRPFATCTWYGSASNGSSPYSYDWTSPVSSSDQYFTYENGSNDGEAFYLTLDVTDAAGYEIPLTETIHVSTNAPICPDVPIRGGQLATGGQ
ncbi:MAG TPA: hypothetical protein VNF92_01380 [Gemmatimonadaceae bacterium]|nr:hypothetical protein [Gemmatimonadaceae bacterium]